MTPDQRRTLLLAYGIAEWQSAIDHLSAMSAAGVEVPSHMQRNLVEEFDVLVEQFAIYWANSTSIRTPVDETDAVPWARRYLADHPVELEALTREE